jgi:hypothetical protein
MIVQVSSPLVLLIAVRWWRAPNPASRVRDTGAQPIIVENNACTIEFIRLLIQSVRSDPGDRSSMGLQQR